MGEKTTIAWCHHSFNPWWGCVEVSPGCDHCYARNLADRYGHTVWGKDGERRFFGDKHWNEPLRWNRSAEAAGERRRVFCASMADVFEGRNDNDVRIAQVRARERLWGLIMETSHLDWLLLTKRPAAMRRMLPTEIMLLPNVWPGVSVESTDYLWRLDELGRIESAGPRWVSYEPALELVDFDLRRRRWLRWVVVGGESQSGARPFDLAWARSVIAQCRDADAVPFVKQFGVSPYESSRCPSDLPRQGHRGKWDDPAEWPADLRVLEFPSR